MDTRKIGSLDVSLVGLGCNNFGMTIDESASTRVVHAAIDAGVTFFDTADIYGGTKSELFLGRALAGRRDAVVIATKFGMRVDAARQGARPEYVRQAAEDSLRRLGVERIDLYQLHQPDPAVPIADTLGALDDLVRAGKVREIGCSNFSAEQLREARGATRTGSASFVSVQNEFSLLNREPTREVLPECEPQPVVGILALRFRGTVCDRRGARRLGPRPRSFTARPGHVVARLARGDCLGHRRGDVTGAGASQRRRRRLATDAGRTGRDRRNPRTTLVAAGGRPRPRQRLAPRRCAGF
jgi:aldo/keto reductase family protein